MPVEHLLEERRSRTRQADDEDDIVDRLDARRGPALALREERPLLGEVEEKALEVEARGGVGVRRGREVEGLAVAPLAVEEADRLEARGAAQDGAALAGREGAQRVDRRRPVALRKEPRSEEGEPRIGRMRGDAREMRLGLVDAPREPVGLAERDRGLARIGRAAEEDARQRLDPAIDAAEALREDSREEEDLRVARREPQEFVEIGVGLGDPAELELRAHAAEPAREAPARLRDLRVGDGEGAARVARGERTVDGDRGRFNVAHAATVTRPPRRITRRSRAAPPRRATPPGRARGRGRARARRARVP